MELKELVADAWSQRDSVDLSNIGYGRVHWDNFSDILRKPFSYYYFLAGLARVTTASKVLEIGTHQGGSARALARGMKEGGRIVTFDVTPDGAKALEGDPTIRAFTMDANSEAAFSTAMGEFGGTSIDLAYIDSTHEFWTTLQSFTICASAFRCPLIVLDDITLNDSMKRVWKIIQERYGRDNAINAVDVHPEIRIGGSGTNPGFGLVRIC